MIQECKYKKRLQFYLDGWTKGDEARSIEEHLKQCAACQIELAELAELQGAASEIIDQAPEKEYWDSFTIRVRNRILSRNIAPEEIVENRPSSRFFSIRLAAISTTVLAAFVILMFVFNPAFTPSPPSTILPGSTLIRTQPPVNIDKTVGQEMAAAPVIQNNAAPSLNEKLETSNQNKISAPAKQKKAPRNLGSVPERDISREFRADQRWDKASPRLDDSPKFPAYALSPNGAISDPALRMKPSALSEGIMSSSDDQGGIAAVYHGPMYNYQSSPSSGAAIDLESELPSSWGYLRVPSDSSSNGESKKYLIELELMQIK